MSVAGPKVVTVSAGSGPSLDPFANLGNITLNRADVSTCCDGPGDIYVRAGNLVLNDSVLDAGGEPGGGLIDIRATDNVLVRNGSTLFVDDLGESAPAGKVNVFTPSGDVRFTNSEIIASGSSGGSVKIDAVASGSARVVFTNSNIDATGSSDGGDVNIFGGGNVRIQGASVIDVGTTESGKAGSISLSAGNFVRVLDGVELKADNRGSGDGGFINLRGFNVVVNDSLVNAEASDGQAGQIAISGQTGVVRVVNGSRITVNNNRSGQPVKLRLTPPGGLWPRTVKC